MLTTTTRQQESKTSNAVDTTSSTTIFKKILIVDDALINRKILKRMLKGYTCVDAEDGIQAVKEVKDALNTDKPVDLVLMDLEMPKMNGQEATDEIRKSGNMVPIICVSTAVSDDNEFKKLQGMNDYVQKPVKKEALRSIVVKYTKEPISPHFSARRSKDADTVIPELLKHVGFHKPPLTPINTHDISLSVMGLAVSPGGDTSYTPPTSPLSCQTLTCFAS